MRETVENRERNVILIPVRRISAVVRYVGVYATELQTALLSVSLRSVFEWGRYLSTRGYNTNAFPMHIFLFTNYITPSCLLARRRPGNGSICLCLASARLESRTDISVSIYMNIPAVRLVRPDSFQITSSSSDIKPFSAIKCGY
jgi:hypothetical protein